MVACGFVLPAFAGFVEACSRSESPALLFTYLTQALLKYYTFFSAAQLLHAHTVCLKDPNIQYSQATDLHALTS